MKVNGDKLLFNAIVAGMVTYGVWTLYKNKDKIKNKIKELIPEKNPEYNPEDVGLTYEEIMERRTHESFDKELERRTTNIKELGDVNPGDIIHEDDWYELNGRIVRNITTVEVTSGIDYDPTKEEVIEVYGPEGEKREVVAKLVFAELANNSEQRHIKDVTESVEDFTDTIHILKKGGSSPVEMRATYAPDSIERLDYFYATIMDIAGIKDMELRRKLINLFTWDYIPNMDNAAEEGIYEHIRNERIDFFTFNSPHINRVSVGEVILYFAENYFTDLSERRGNVEFFAKFMVDNIPLNFDGSEHDAIIHDTLISYMSHGRSLHPNVTGGFGLFGIDEDAYESTTTLATEYQRSVERLLNDPHYKLPVRVKEK